jgi:hypothetical protein
MTGGLGERSGGSAGWGGPRRWLSSKGALRGEQELGDDGRTWRKERGECGMLAYDLDEKLEGGLEGRRLWQVCVFVWVGEGRGGEGRRQRVSPGLEDDDDSRVS